MDSREYEAGRAELPAPVTAPIWQALVCSDGDRCDDCRDHIEADRRAAWEQWRRIEADRRVAWQRYWQRQQQASSWYVQDPLVSSLQVDMARDVGGVPVVTVEDARHAAAVQALGILGLVILALCILAVPMYFASEVFLSPPR